jgi:hypothetical protein
MGNILGQSFSDYVKQQINKRQSRLGGSYLRDTTIAAYNSKAPYIKLTSAVNISFISSPSTDPIQRKLVQQENDRIRKKFEDLGVPSADMGDGLAKNFILFGGASNESGDLKSGFNNGDLYSGAYGWGGFGERGPVPMPGITSAQTKYYNNGALSQATINIKCFSKKQFAIIDLLYLRPGFTLLLEFGHSVYSKNNDTIAQGFSDVTRDSDGIVTSTTPKFNTNACKAVLNGTSDQFEIYDKIESAREASNGNYDAVYGKISKFNWKFNNDGSYDCTVTLIGLGSIIESLKLNNGQSLSLIDTDEFQGAFYEYLVRKAGEEIAVEAGVEEGSFQSNQYKVNTQIALRDIDNVFSQDIKTKLLSKYAVSYLHLAMYNIKWQGSKDLEAALQAEATDIRKQLREAFEGGSYRGSANYKKYKQLYNNTYSQLQELGKMTVTDYRMGNCDFNEDGSRGQQIIPKSVFTLQGVRADGEEDVESPQIYIKFGLLISLMQEKLLVYTKKNKPFFRFDMVRGSDFVVNGKNQQFINDENYILNPPGQISGNPFICIIPHTNIPDVPDFKNIDLFDGGINKSIFDAAGDPGFQVGGDEYTGRLANILVNIDHIINVLQNNTDASTGDVSILNFLKTILADISRALGGVNQIDITVSDDGLVKFIEKVPPQYGGIIAASGTPATINAFGVGSAGSFVRDVSLESELSSNFAAMIAIGAQSNGNQLGTNATNFAKYNLGLEDRVIKDKISYFNQISNVEPTTLNDLVDDLIIAYIRVYSKLNFSSSNISALESANRRYLEFLLGALSNNNQMTPPAFLPFNLKLTMDGISGMKLFERFKISDNILPPAYNKDDVDLIVKEINHTVGVNGWTTEIGTLSAPSFTKTVGVLNRKNSKPFPAIPAEYLESAFDQSVLIDAGVVTAAGATGASGPITIPRGDNIDNPLKDYRGYVVWNQESLALNSERQKNFNMLNFMLFFTGIYNPYARMAILAGLHKECGLIPKYELSYKNNTASEIRGVFREQVNVKSLTDQQLETLVAGGEPGLSSRLYQNIIGNGPASSGDGYTFRGRGFVQLTGRGNYKEISKRFKAGFEFGGPHPDALYKITSINLENTPDKAIKDRFLAAAIAIEFLINKSKTVKCADGSRGFNWNRARNKAEAINAVGCCIAGGRYGTAAANDGVKKTLASSKHMLIQGQGGDYALVKEREYSLADNDSHCYKFKRYPLYPPGVNNPPQHGIGGIKRKAANNDAEFGGTNGTITDTAYGTKDIPAHSSRTFTRLVKNLSY